MKIDSDSVMQNFEQFKEFEVEQIFLGEGDFGIGKRISFENEKFGGYVDFWDTGWVNIYLVDYTIGEEVLNYLLEPSEKERVNAVMTKLFDNLKG